MICPHCGQETKPVNHNDRGLRCGACWGVLPEPVQEPPKPDTKPLPNVEAPPQPKARPAPRVTRRQKVVK